MYIIMHTLYSISLQYIITYIHYIFIDFNIYTFTHIRFNCILATVYIRTLNIYCI